MKETITLQLGEFSNYVGSHYWNYQLLACLQQSQSGEGEEGEEGFHQGSSEVASRLFREQARDGVFQPRILISDLRLNVGRLIGDLDDTGDESGGDDAVLEWGGGLSKMTRCDVPDRNPFQQFLQSCGVESYDGESVFMRRGGGAGASGGRAILSSTAAAPPVARRPPESCIEYWTDFSSVSLDRDVNLCLMPRWTTRDNFDTFLSVHLPEVVPREYTENFMDKLRFLAEECDSLSTIQVFADIHNGFGALACRLAQEIREDYGRGVNLPVWAFAADDEASEQGARAARSDLGESLHRLSVPYVYSQLCEHASLVVPIAPSAARSQRGLPFLTLDRGSQYHSSAVVASAIEAATGFQNDLGASMSADEWFFKTTSSGRFPVCELETTLPFPLAPSDSLEDFARLFGPTGVSGEMLEKMSARDDRNRERGGGGAESKEAPRRSFALNPFLHSLSSTTEGPFAVSSAVADKRFAQSGGADPEYQYRREHQRPFTNMVSIRGPCPEKLPALLFSKCDSPSYLVTACIRQQSALAVPSTFPHFFRGVDWSGWAREKESAMGAYASQGTFSTAMQQQQLQQLGGLRGAPCTNITVLSAVGCDARVGVHLEHAASAWARSVGNGRIRAQIEKVGGDKTELAEIGEKILVLSRAYDQHNEL